ncbi:uncharacterized protein BXZ73DRAFT_73668 [Epithele typhae]|uniref:uncharacterized protein n=1 Tax=Epithele typhae TaxID=378194 RepID=UPI0020076D5B|nr:uncharacterized protein BXZ73DRAFT_73668 [Epithele typhae]KAH9944033.1 hypothetical protein BXZ73DRAFT_73668 [Epithele typhae]
MAAPAEMTSRDISGKFVMNKSLSGKTDEILRLQGVSWLTRKAISVAVINLSIKHYTDDNGVEHIDIDQTLSGGIPGTAEYRTFDGTERTNEDHVFGPVLSKSMRVPLGEIETNWLKQDWMDESFVDEGVIATTAKSDTGKSGKTWYSEQVWGFEQVDGTKRYARHVFFKGPQGEEINVRLVYDYQGPQQ